MHKCAKCGRAATSLEEIDAGCPCGSKVFTFDRQMAHAVSAPDAVAFEVPKEGGNGKDADGAEGKTAAQEGRVPESYFARMSFTNEDIENIKVLTQGVFLLDVRAIGKNPVVLKDEDEIYYVKLPLEQKKAAKKEAPAQKGSGNNGKK